MKRGPVQNTLVLVNLVAQIQQNGDGTWTVIIDAPVSGVGPITGKTRADAVIEAISLFEAKQQL